MVTNYPSNFVGRYYGLETNLKIIDVAPLLSIRLNKQWTVGAALIARRSTATLSEGVDFGGIEAASGFQGPTAGSADGVATLTGSCWSYGFKLGTTYQPSDDLRFGVGFQSADNLKISGNVAYDGVPAAMASTFTNGSASTTLNLPATASAGFTWDINKDVSLQGEMSWTGWSTFKSLDIKFASGLPDEIDQENWKNTWFYSLGSIWKLNQAWSLKAGVAYDQTPVPDTYRTPRIPDANRTWLSLGAAWNASKAVTVDVGVTRIICKPVTVDLVSGTSAASPNYYKGNLSGSYDVGATVIAASARYRF
jgi:long-chain fatty acid transport protein